MLTSATKPWPPDPSQLASEKPGAVQYLHQNKLANRIFRIYQQIVDTCCDAWNFFANDPDFVTFITARN